MIEDNFERKNLGQLRGRGAVTSVTRLQVCLD
jgi:hypothetical protein